MPPRKICVVTGTRAEYGLLYWLLKEIDDDPDLELQIVVTGMHLSPEFGLTWQVIEKDGFKINEKLEMLLSSDTPVGIAKSIGLATIGFADALNRLKPHIIVLLGDRFEILACAQAAMVARIPLAHLHGGEATEGLIDEAIRHAVTKMSHIHFVANKIYQKRVIQLGENPKMVFCYGSPGLDNVTRLKLLKKEEFEKSIDFRLGKVNFLITYHPVTLENSSEEALKELFAALDQFKEARFIFTRPNADTESRILIKMIDDFVEKRSDRAVVFTSLGQRRYLSALRHVDIVIGNSSSGLTEVPSFRKPTINLGNRQRGRLKADSVIDCLEKEEEIVRAINKALSHQFSEILAQTKNPYGESGASVKIKERLKKISLEGLIVKNFNDLDFQWISGRC